jgi:hypothetical protein
LPLAESREDGPFIDVIATQSIRHALSNGFPTAGAGARIPHGE